MLFHPIPGRPETLRKPLLASLGVHLLALAAVLYRPAPALLKASPALRGNGGRGNAIALAAPGISAPGSLRRSEEGQRRLAPPTRRRKSRAPESPAQAAADSSLMPGMPGFVLGSLASGLAANHDVRVAISVVAPDPPIVRAKLPEWIRGDVVVEITIDEKGDVVAARLLHSVGFGLDEIVVETLRHWHFIPAKVDGIAVASREDVHFHFPS